MLFDQGSGLEALSKGEPKTTLTAWFQINKSDEKARLLLYPDFPKKYTWNQNGKKWQRRKRDCNNLGRIPCVPFNVKTIELYCLRILLHHVPGACGYDELKTVNGNILPSFQAACVELGLLDDETEINHIFQP